MKTNNIIIMGIFFLPILLGCLDKKVKTDKKDRNFYIIFNPPK